MTHNISKENIFNFLKAQSIIEEISNKENIEINETDKNAKLKRVTITNLNQNSKYWVLNTEANTFQPQGKKVEKIILEQTENNILNIILIELKSNKINQSDIIEKFTNSLNWLYILVNLLHNKQNQKIKVFGILISQNETIKWNETSTLRVLSSTSIRYIKRAFYTSLKENNLTLQELLKGT